LTIRGLFRYSDPLPADIRALSKRSPASFTNFLLIIEAISFILQHTAAFLPLMKRKGFDLLIEKGVSAWYYVIAARETDPKQ